MRSQGNHLAPLTGTKTPEMARAPHNSGEYDLILGTKDNACGLIELRICNTAILTLKSEAGAPVGNGSVVFSTIQKTRIGVQRRSLCPEAVRDQISRSARSRGEVCCLHSSGLETLVGKEEILPRLTRNWHVSIESWYRATKNSDREGAILGRSTKLPYSLLGAEKVWLISKLAGGIHRYGKINI